jgi:hypothetical protein
MKFWPPDGPFRWAPKHGDPQCLAEWTTQAMIKLLAFLPVYVAVVVTLLLVVAIYGVSLLRGIVE